MNAVANQMIMSRTELEDAARQMFGSEGLRAPAGKGWENFVSQGWAGLALPAEDGGLGGSIADQAVLYQELGRVLGSEPILAAWNVIDALASAGSQACEPVLAELLAGSQATLSLHDLVLIEGGLRAVPDADRARWLLCWTDDRHEARLVSLEQDDIIVTVRNVWDRTRRLFDVQIGSRAFDAAILIASGPAASRLHDDIKVAQLISLAADSVGGAQAMLTMTIDYLETRRQFERPLAMFQALKHRCADMKTAIEGADALLWRAIGGRDLPDISRLVSTGMVKAHATRTFAFVAEECLQLHGGIGMTEEHPCHWFLKRALLNEALGGGVDWEEKGALERLSTT